LFHYHFQTSYELWYFRFLFEATWFIFNGMELSGGNFHAHPLLTLSGLMILHYILLPLLKWTRGRLSFCYLVFNSLHSFSAYYFKQKDCGFGVCYVLISFFKHTTFHDWSYFAEEFGRYFSTKGHVLFCQTQNRLSLSIIELNSEGTK
jgi:hypothetical protein